MSSKYSEFRQYTEPDENGNYEDTNKYNDALRAINKVCPIPQGAIILVAGIGYIARETWNDVSFKIRHRKEKKVKG